MARLTPKIKKPWTCSCERPWTFGGHELWCPFCGHVNPERPLTADEEYRRRFALQLGRPE